MRIAEIYRRQAKHDLALESLKKADALVPESAEVPYSMAAVYQAQGRYDEAIKLLQDLLKKTETSQSERNNRGIFIERLGMIYREQENYTAAVETFRRMMPLGDDNVAVAISRLSTPTARPNSGRKPPTWPAKPAETTGPPRPENCFRGAVADTGDPDNALGKSGRCSKAAPKTAPFTCVSADVHAAEALE